MKFCPECGNKLIPGAKFCPECGNKLDNKLDSAQNDITFSTKKDNFENYEKADLYAENEVSEIQIEKKRMYSSEEYIIAVLNQEHINDYEVIPNIEEKKVINAAASIANGINPTTLIALYDTSLLSNGKTGIVFAVKGIYLKAQFEESLFIPFKDIDRAEKFEEKIVTDENKHQYIKSVKVFYKNGDSIKFDSNIYSSDFPYKLLTDFLNDFNIYVNKISSKTQIVQLSQMKDEVIELYFRIIIAYLKDDDGIIDSKEYKELVSLMTKVKVNSTIAENLRKYRFENTEVLSLDELIEKLKKELEEANISEEAVEQSLAMDIIGTHYDMIEKIDENEVLLRMLNRLGVDSEKLQFIIRKIKADHEILETRLDDNQIKEIGKELAAVASGAGVSLGALAVTGAVTGWGASLSGGMLALGLSTGGTFLGVAALATAGFGVYKGIKYFSGTGQLEKYGIRIKVLNDNITALRIANTYIIEDINWLSSRTIEFAHKLNESNALSDELLKELEFIVVQNQALADAGNIINDEQKNSEFELLLTSVPETLNIGQYNELLVKNINKIHYDEVIKSAYQIEGDVDGQSELVQVKLRNDITLENLQNIHSILDEIGYFDTKSASIAQSKAFAKKGFTNLKKTFFDNKNE